MRHLLTTMVMCACLLPAALLMVGCDETIEQKRTVEHKEDGTTVTREKTVTESPDGTVTKTEEKKVDR